MGRLRVRAALTGGVGLFLVLVFAAVQSFLATRSAIDAKSSVRVPFSPHALLASGDLLVVGSPEGRVVGFNTITGDRATPEKLLRHPADVLVAHGVAVFVGGEHWITRLAADLSPQASAHLTAVDTSRFAAGPAGLWAPSASGHSIVRLGAGRMRVSRSIPVDGGVAAVAVGRSAVWVALRGKNRVALIDTDRASKVLEIAVPAPATSVVAYGDEAIALLPSLNAAIVLSARPAAVERTIRVGAEGQSIAVGNGSAWILAPQLGHVTQVGLSSGRRVGRPIGVGLEPRGVVVDVHAIWVGEGQDFTLTRVDLNQLSAGRLQHAAAVRDLRWFLVISVIVVGLGVVLAVRIWMSANVNRAFPRYAGVDSPIDLLSLNDTRWDRMSFGKIVERKSVKEPGISGGSAGINFSLRSARTELIVQEIPIRRSVARAIAHRISNGVIYIGLAYAPEAKHRGLRRTLCPDPSRDKLREQFRGIADRPTNTACLFPRAEVEVEADGEDLQLTLKCVFDRGAGWLSPLLRPDGSWIRMRVRREDLKARGQDELVGGTTRVVDILAIPCRDSLNEENLRCDVVACWIPTTPVADYQPLVEPNQRGAASRRSSRGAPDRGHFKRPTRVSRTQGTMFEADR